MWTKYFNIKNVNMNYKLKLLAKFKIFVHQLISLKVKK